MHLFVHIQVYNDADVLEKILKDRRRDLGPPVDDDDLMMTPRLKISKLEMWQSTLAAETPPTPGN